MHRFMALAAAMAAVLFLANPGQTEESAKPASNGFEIATFAAGCFWCVEADFDKVPGVVATMPGYTGGHTKNPTYWQVASETTGHAEAVQVTFDPKKISYQSLLQHYWHGVDPLDGSGQFCDRGNSYRPAIFTHSPQQQQLAESSKAEVAQRFSQPIKVQIAPASEFTPAEPEHRKYYQTHAYRYRFYRLGCGRDARLRALWGEAAATH